MMPFNFSFDFVSLFFQRMQATVFFWVGRSCWENQCFHLVRRIGREAIRERESYCSVGSREEII